MEDAEPSTIAASLDMQARAAGAVWAVFFGFFGVVIAVASQQVGVFVGAMVLAACAYAFCRAAALSPSVERATMRDKFITRKKRREYVVLGSRHLRVNRPLFDHMHAGTRYLIHSNAAGAVVFDLDQP